MDAEDLASLDDLALQWRPTVGDDEDARATGLLSAASSLMRTAVPNVDQRIDDGRLDPKVVAIVVAGVVARFLTNPEGAATTTVATGPYSKSVTWVNRATGAQIVGRLQVTADDIAQLTVKPGRNFGSMRLKAGLSPRNICGDAGRAYDAEIAGQPYPHGFQ